MGIYDDPKKSVKGWMGITLLVAAVIVVVGIILWLLGIIK